MLGLDYRNGVGKAERCNEVCPVARGDHDDHRALAIARDEIAPEQSVDRIAEALAVCAGVENLGDAAEI